MDIIILEIANHDTVVMSLWEFCLNSPTGFRYRHTPISNVHLSSEEILYLEFHDLISEPVLQITVEGVEAGRLQVPVEASDGQVLASVRH